MIEMKTTCPYCGVGCGVITDGVNLKGDPDHPANFGKLCGKGLALLETIGLEGRLLTAKIYGKPVDTTNAMDVVANRFLQIIKEYGANSIAFYVSGQLLTEDYYVANKLMKGYIGTANIDSNSRLCMASSAAGHKRAFGSDLVPVSYSDLEEAEVIVLVGSNLAWCHPVLFQRILKSKAKVVVIDPRSTMTAREADLHLPLKSDSDLALFLGLLGYLKPNENYIKNYTNGVEEALKYSFSPEEAASICDLPVEIVLEFYTLFQSTEKIITLWSQGINQSEQGTDGVNAIINCHLFTGRIGGKGQGPFSITGQPNAMGGRETGSLANLLTTHFEFSQGALVQEFWNSPRIAASPGLKAVDMFKAVKDGHIKAIWVMATNPAASMPDLLEVQAALQLCEFVVISDLFDNTDTAQFAHVHLPALGWGEKQGTVTNSERRISKQNRFLKAPEQALQDWQLVCGVAQRMGYSGFNYKDESEIFAEFASLSGYKNEGSRAFDISTVTEFPHQWHEKPFEFYTPDKRGQFIATPYQGKEQGLVLNTGRNRDQWHTMSRTGRSARLSSHLAENYLTVHPNKARELGIENADIVECNGVYFRAHLSDEMREGDVFAPIHWTKQNTSHTVNALILAIRDPISGQPALKSTSITLKKVNMLQFGYGVFIDKPEMKADYYSISKIKNGYRAEWANLTPHLTEESQYSFEDLEKGVKNILFIEENKLIKAVYIAQKPLHLARSFIEDRLGEAPNIPSLLAGFPLGDIPDKGAIICACHQVGINEILAGSEQGLKAGTNCGSCSSEVKNILKNR